MNTTKVKPELMFCLAYFSTLMKCGLPVLECLSASRSFLAGTDQWLFEDVEQGLLGGRPTPFHDAFSRIDTIEGRILKHKTKVGEDGGFPEESIYEALLIILLFRKLGAVPAPGDVQRDVELLRSVMQDLRPEDRAEELALLEWPHGAWSSYAVKPEVAKDHASLMSWLVANRKAGVAAADDQIARTLIETLRGNQHVTGIDPDKDIGDLVERILLIVSNEYL